MAAHSSASIRRLGAMAAAVLLAGTVVAAAQTAPAKTVKPATAAKKAAAPASAGQAQSDYWTVKTNLPKQYGAAAARETPARQNNVREYDRATGSYTELGRVPLQTGPGTIGFTSQSTKSGALSDGTVLPGHQAYTQRDDSYTGMSLTVPSSNKSFPIPLLPPPQKMDW
jgi:opacity protein-like surface antigen